MLDSERIEELLDRYEEALETGQVVTVETLCRDDPHLIEAVRKKLALLAKVDGLVAADESEIGIPSEKVAGRYRAQSPLGQGGLGQVFIALDEELEREVALKRLLPGRASDPDNQARFRREAKITGQLEHPGIVPIYGLGSDSKGRPYYAMRRVTGDTLDQAIERYHRKELSLLTVLRNFLTVCQTVAFAHSKGIIHRDLKPQNILVGEFGETLVIDWGLAKPVAEGEPIDAETANTSRIDEVTPTMQGIRKGSPAYMSPEQAEGLPATESSDIYALGATLYKILTGKAPFQEGSRIWERIRTGDFPPARGVRRDVPLSLDAICRKAMSVRVEDRYPRALELASDIEHWLADEPVSAARDPWGVRCRRWMRRHRALVLSALSMLAVGIAAVVVLLLREDQSNKVLKQSNDELIQANQRVTQSLDDIKKANEKVENALHFSRWERDKAQINLASVASGEQKGARAAYLLRQTSPRPGESDNRSWEWYYLSRPFALDRAEIPGPPSPSAIAVSNDGRWVASTNGRQVSLFSVETAKRMFTFPTKPYSLSIAFSPDSRTLAVPNEKTAALWRLQGEDWIHGPAMERFAHRCESLAFAPAGNLLAVSGDGGRLRLFHSGTGKLLADSQELQQGQPSTDDNLEGLAFSADGTRLAGRRLLQPLVFEIEQKKEITSLKLAFRGGKEISAYKVWFEEKQNDLAIQDSNAIRVFDRFHQERKKIALPAEGREVHPILREPSGSYWGLSQGVAWQIYQPRWRDPSSLPGFPGVERFGKPVIQPLRFDQLVSAVGLASNGKTGAFGLRDGRIVITDTISTEPQVIIRHSGLQEVTGAFLTPHGDQLLSFDSGRNACFGPLGSEPRFRRSGEMNPGIGPSSTPWTGSLSNDGALFGIRDARNISVIESSSGRTLLTLASAFEGGLFPTHAPLGFSPDGSRLAFTLSKFDFPTQKFTSHEVRVWNLKEDREILRFPSEGQALDLAYSPDGQKIALAQEHEVLLYSSDGSRGLQRLKGRGPFNRVAFSPDGLKIAAGSNSGEVTVWKLSDPKEGEVFSLHSSEITGLNFFPGSRLLASSGTDGFIRLFDVVDRLERGTLPCRLPIKSLALAADGKTIVAGCEQGLCMVFRAAEDATIVRRLQKQAQRPPDRSEIERDLAIAAWGWYLERRRENDEVCSQQALEIGVQACEKLENSPETESWTKAFQSEWEKLKK
ncbi:protein kinase [Telmatocola sphagniphila]|uniref:Protein kinase n=1 Tax=Telmatocola sphagniphila TaxID=1123043 RepID=A0A8E6EWG2_9BACT|nr:protein kinase [Telmatocola sphagniphila]QVL33955.1 protein kinase [Telmatocola sphagniphila]